MKRIELTSLSLRNIIEHDIKHNLPFRIEKIYISTNKFLCIRTEKIKINIHCDKSNPFVSVSRNVYEKSNVNFNDALNSYIKGLTATDVRQINFDRIFEFVFANGYRMVIELIPNKFNIIIADENLIIKNLYSYTKNSEGDVVRNIGAQYTYPEKRAETKDYIDKKTSEYMKLNNISEERIFQSTEFFLCSDSKRYFILPFEDELCATADRNSSVSKLIESAVEAETLLKSQDSTKRAMEKISERINSLIGKAEKFDDSEDINAKIATLKERAETLRANLYAVNGRTDFTFPSVLDENRKIEYFMKRSVPPSAYLEELFDKIKNLKNKIDANKIYRAKILNEIEKLKKELAETETEGTVKDAVKKKAVDEYKIGRVFVSPNGFNVYSGRNAKENDELTVKIAKKDDIFFHAREAKGSHVILKSGGREPMKEDIIFAASVAAHFSAGKHSSLVEVSYAEKKYVTKRRGSPAGEVVMLRETVVFVEPAKIH